MGTTINLDYVLHLARQLSPVDKVRLIERIAPEIAQNLPVTTNAPRKSLRGLWQGIEITPDDITAMRREMWRDFPRESL